MEFFISVMLLMIFLWLPDSQQESIISFLHIEETNIVFLIPLVVFIIFRFRYLYLLHSLSERNSERNKEDTKKYQNERTNHQNEITRYQNEIKELEKLNKQHHTTNFNLKRQLDENVSETNKYISENIELKRKLYDTLSKTNEYLTDSISLRKQLDDERSKREDIEDNYEECHLENAKLKKQIEEYETYEKEVKSRADFHDEIMENLNLLLKDKKEGYKWLAGMMADFMTIAEYQYQKSLEWSYNTSKNERAFTIKELRQEKKELIKENKILHYEIDYLKSLMPDAYNIEDIQQEHTIGENYRTADWIYNYLPKDEYDKLSDTEKNKRALEYYFKREKSKWEIGRDFEMYIGYLYEKSGCHVTYYGIEKKLHDLGRDLIVENGEVVKIVQCKYWSKEKTIHEKHIMQLFGTTMKYRIDHRGEKRKIEAVFVTHTTVSNTAREFAQALEVSLRENVELGDYPIIKCNVGKDEYGIKTKIYHLPMDQQYDNTTINTKIGDFLASTIEEAEAAGFRRAYRWYGT
jgi:hypothetical protein